LEAVKGVFVRKRGSGFSFQKGWVAEEYVEVELFAYFKDLGSYVSHAYDAYGEVAQMKVAFAL
jgi:hypothetical protein